MTETLPDLYEVVDGQLIEKETNVHTGGITAEIASELGSFVQNKNRGRTYAYMLYRLNTLKRNERRPNVSLVSYAKWPKGKGYPDDRAWDIIPDLCVEVVSPTDQADDIREKVEEYFEAGIPAVWVVYPQQELVDVYETPGTAHRTFRRSDTLTGSGVLSGFSLPLSELFLR